MLRKAVVTIAAVAAFAAVAVAQNKTNFSGTWKLNTSKSDFGMIPGPTSRTDVIDHKDPSLKVSVTAEVAQGKQQYTVSYTTDGKEAVNSLPGREMKSTLSWQGKSLVVDTKLKFQGNDVTVKSTWTLSDDGKTLTQSAHIGSPMGETDQKLVFDKQ
jgi:uncharacterized lipoprotein NlpE involved in copper resistance